MYTCFQTNKVQEPHSMDIRAYRCALYKGVPFSLPPSPGIILSTSDILETIETPNSDMTT